MISVCFQGKPFNITVIQVYPQPVTLKKLQVNGSMKTRPARTNTQKRRPFQYSAKVGSQETLGVTGKFGLGVWNEAGQRLVEF